MSSSEAESAAKTQRIAEAGMPVEAARVAPPGLRGVLGLRRQRRRLLKRREALVYDLGGLAIELVHRGLLEQPAVRSRAQLVADVDESVRWVDDQLDAAAEHARGSRRRHKGGPEHRCPVCNTMQDAVAIYCPNCGERLPWRPRGAAGDPR